MNRFEFDSGIPNQELFKKVVKKATDDLLQIEGSGDHSRAHGIGSLFDNTDTSSMEERTGVQWSVSTLVRFIQGSPSVQIATKFSEILSDLPPKDEGLDTEMELDFLAGDALCEGMKIELLLRDITPEQMDEYAQWFEENKPAVEDAPAVGD